MNHYLLLFSLFLLTLSCSKQKEIEKVELIKKRTLSIPYEHSGELFSATIAYDNTDSTEYIISVYPPDCMIYIYDLKTGKLRKKIKSPEPIVPRIAYYLNKDSIFITRHSSNEIALINDRGELINKWEFYKDTNFVSIMQFPVNCFSVIDNSIIMQGSASRARMLDNYYSKTACIFKYSIEKGNSNVKLEQEIPYSPRFQTDTIWYDPATSFAIRNGKIYVSFSVEHNIFCYDGDKMEAIPAKSKYLNKFLPFERKLGYSIPYVDSMYVVKPYYDGIYYDRNNDLFFRKAVHQIPISYDGKRISDSEDKPFSFVIFDGNMKPINEVLMPTNLYNYKTLISREGLILGRISDNSDSIKFDIYSIKVKR